METIKFYSSKSNAKRAATKAGIDMSTAELREKDGQFAYVAPAAPVVEEDDLSVSDNDQRLIDRCGHSHCPCCGIHLDNGVASYEDILETNRAEAKKMTHNWECLGCGHQFGEELKPAAKQTKGVVLGGNGLKIEKVREERNGVKRPSIGGMCRAVWDACDAIVTNTGENPTVAQVKETAAACGWNANNAVIEYYQWRKFMGIRGRQAKKAE